MLNGTILGAAFGTGRAGNKVTPKLVPFSVSALAVVASKVETATSIFQDSSKGGAVETGCSDLSDVI